MISLKGKELYVIILVLAVALAGESGYLAAIVTHNYNGSQYSGLSHSGSALYPLITGGEQEAQSGTITVTGSGKVSEKPSLVELELGVVTKETNVTETVSKNAVLMNQVIAALKAMGIREQDMETSDFDLHPRYSTYERLIGFEVRHMLRVASADLVMVGLTIDKAVEAGANRVEGVRFTFEEDELQGLRVLARQAAVEDARAKAETIADSLGVSIIGVASAEETTYYSSSYYDYGFSLVLAGTTTILPPTEAEVTVTIKVTFIIE